MARGPRVVPIARARAAVWLLFLGSAAQAQAYGTREEELQHGVWNVLPGQKDERGATDRGARRPRYRVLMRTE
jgi:hypothetical protein